MRLLPLVLLSFLLAACVTTPPHDPAAQSATNASAARAALDAAVAGSWRTPANVARDGHRHPAQTLAFFGLQPGQTVIEITPGAGWYSEVLAPFLRENGRYIAAVPDDAIPGQPKYRYDLNARLRAKFAAQPQVYSSAQMHAFDPKAPRFGAASSADVVLTFRNAHNWVADGNADAYFQAFFQVLKPGGTLGVVDHRAKPGTALETMMESGYLTEALVIDLATRAGFVLDERSEVNANPKDDTQHPNGVWTLPPTNDHEAKDDAMYRAIGESDRMTLRFRKPR